jgi:N-acetylneuraminic acid mutarotase
MLFTKNILFFIFFNLIIEFNLISQNYTWMHGSNSNGVTGIYGTQGISSPTIDPGGRHGAATWVDASGNLWLFGGEGYSTSNNVCWLNDLWKYNVSTNQWTWIRGSNGPNQIGNYGLQGIASVSNEPGSREFSASWVDASGNFWLFGGDGFSSNNTFGRLGDLWKYNPITNIWIWMKGFNIINQNGVYGSQSTPSINNNPGARYASATWLDATGNLYMFGGRGFPASGFGGFLNDFWKYNVTSNQWTWINGSNLTGQIGNYGTINITSPSNSPGGKEFPSFWKGSNGLFYLFGGRSSGYFNDLWKYDPIGNLWTWISGSNIGNQLATYGTMGIASATNIPGGRFTAASWSDGLGDLWLFGGTGWTSTNLNPLNDLWKYKPSTGEWTWMKGSNLTNQAGTYGIIGIPSINNNPGGRLFNTWWKEIHTDFWLLGGEGYDSNGINFDHMNDLWKFKPPCNPDSIITSSIPIICSGSSITFTALNQFPSNLLWYNSPTSSVSIASGSVFNSPTLTSINSQTVYNYYAEANSCSISPRSLISVTVNSLPVLSIIGPTAVCFGTSSSFSAMGALSYTWNNGAITQSISISSINASLNINLIGKDINGCVNTQSHVVVPLPLPNLTISPLTSSICLTESISINVTGSNTYSWSTGSNSSSIIVSPVSNSSYSVIGTNTASGCKSIVTNTITVFPLPIISIISSHSIICLNQSATITANTSNTYSWSNGIINSPIIVSPSLTTVYTVTASNSITTCKSSKQFTLSVSKCLDINTYKNDEILISVFPNPTNGIFAIETFDLDIDIKIYNPLGLIIFSEFLNKGIHHLNLSSFSDGLYLIEIKTIKGILNKKIIKAN